jgi:hypothetical protein
MWQLSFDECRRIEGNKLFNPLVEVGGFVVGFFFFFGTGV